MDIISILLEGLVNGIKAVFTITKIVIPLMIIMEFLKDYKVIDKVAHFLKPMSRLLGISKRSIFPLVIGLILGLSYGAGVIIKEAKEGELSKKDLYLLIIFLVACHSVIEDTLLFVAIGANGWFLITFRIIIAVLLTVFVSKHLGKYLDEDKVEKFTS